MRYRHWYCSDVVIVDGVKPSVAATFSNPCRISAQVGSSARICLSHAIHPSVAQRPRHREIRPHLSSPGGQQRNTGRPRVLARCTAVDSSNRHFTAALTPSSIHLIQESPPSSPQATAQGLLPSISVQGGPASIRLNLVFKCVCTQGLAKEQRIHAHRHSTHPRPTTLALPPTVHAPTPSPLIHAPPHTTTYQNLTLRVPTCPYTRSCPYPYHSASLHPMP